MLHLSHFPFDMNYLFYSFSNKAFDGCYFIHKVITRITFLLQLLYTCFVLSRRSFIMLYGSLRDNKSFRLFFLLFATRILFFRNNPFKISLFCNKWKLSLIILVAFGPLGFHFVEKITPVVTVNLFSCVISNDFTNFFKSIMNCFWIMTSASEIILIFCWFRWIFIICTANMS